MKHIMKWPAMLLAGIACLCDVHADCVPMGSAPHSFANPNNWGNDAGPLIPGFLEMSDRGGRKLELQHGLDLSHHNAKEVSFDEVKRCGTNFAIVKMDEKFPYQSTELWKRGITVIPYYYLSVIANDATDYKYHPEKFSATNGDELSPDELALRLEDARAMGRYKAKEFLQRYNDSVDNVHRSISIAGIHGTIVAVDVEEAFKVKSTRQQNQMYGKFYAAMLSSWTTEIRKSMPDVILIFYTFPDMFMSYLNFANADDHAVIGGMPVWLARPRPDGGDIALTNLEFERLCKSTPGGNRCVVQQYTHRGLFGVYLVTQPEKAKSSAQHLDVDRFFQVKVVHSASNDQYVRQ